uniref:Uncharacterized protein n=1 Tax=Panagrolaimus sp. ES5 TaxID=591445 RepID=A0AC34FP62_9BILA
MSFKNKNFSVIALTELAIPYLEKTKGNIVCVSTISAKRPCPEPFYGIAKAGLDHVVRNYAAILAPSGIRINTLNPGVTDTNFFLRHSEKFFDGIKKAISIPLGRLGTLEDMANFLIFVASDKASYMTGQNVVVDGGVLINSPTIKFD